MQFWQAPETKRLISFEAHRSEHAAAMTKVFSHLHTLVETDIRNESLLET